MNIEVAITDWSNDSIRRNIPRKFEGTAEISDIPCKWWATIDGGDRIDVQGVEPADCATDDRDEDRFILADGTAVDYDAIAPLWDAIAEHLAMMVAELREAEQRAALDVLAAWTAAA